MEFLNHSHQYGLTQMLILTTILTQLIAQDSQLQHTPMHLLNSKSSTVNSQLRIVLRSHPVSKFIKILRNVDLNIQKILLKLTLRGNLIPNAVRPVEMEKKPEVELALGEYVRLLLLVTWLKPLFAIKEIVSYIKNTFVTAWKIFQKGIQLSSWGDLSNCDLSTDIWSTCERTRFRSCLKVICLNKDLRSIRVFVMGCLVKL